MIKVRLITYYFIFLLAKSNKPPIRKLKKTVRWMLGIILSLYIGTILLLNIPYVQRQMSVLVANELSNVLGTQLTIGRINMGLLNRIIIDDLLLDDQSGKEMLKVSRLSAKFDILPLFKGKISISNVQLFGFNINLEKKTPEDIPNFQFVLDAFASKDTIKKESNLDLRINSLLIRRGRMSYNVLSAEETPGKFNAQHIQLRNIIANISLKALQNDSINAAIKRLSIEEGNSGFELRKLSLKIVANNQKMNIENFAIDLPNTSLAMDTIRMEYDSLEAFNNFANDVHFSFRMLPSDIALCDLAAFVPAFSPFREKLQIAVETNGTVNQLNCPHLSITGNQHFHLRGDVSLQDLSRPQDAFVFGNLSSLYADPEGVAFFVRNLSKNYEGVPPILQRLGTISFRGEVSGYFTDLVTYGLVHTDIGSIKTDLKLSSNKEKGYFAYSGAVKTEEFELGNMLANEKLGKVTFNLNVEGSHYEKQYPSIVMKGLVASIDYSDYTYENITLDGEYKQGGFNGKVALNDENGSVLLNGNINTASHVPTFNFQADIRKVRPHELHLTPNYEDAEVSVQLTADFTGGSIDEMNGEINIDSLQFTAPDKNYFLDNLKIAAIRRDESHKELKIASNFLNASIEGDYSYRTLPASVLNIMRRYIPALILPNKQQVESENNFHFDVNIFNTDLFSTLFNIPVKVYTHSTLKGYFNDKAQRLRVEGYFPRLRYGDKFIESGMILCENPGDKFHARLRFSNRKSTGAINVALETQAKDDIIQTSLNWGNSSTVTYSGKLAATTHFIRTQAGEQDNKHIHSGKGAPALRTVVDVQKTDVILNDTLWEIHPSQVVIDSGKVHINDFYFSHKDRHLRINGVISEQPEDTVRLDLKDINIGYVFDIADLGVNFQGEATGPAYASGVLKKPVMYTDLFIRRLGLNDGLLGDANIHGEWHHEVEGIYLDAHIREKDIAKTHVSGYIYPIKPKSALDLQIEADSTNLKFIEYFMRSITPEFNGRASGNVHFYGKFKGLTMEGRVFGDASMKVDVLNTTFFIKDSIRIEPNGLTFNNNRIFDTHGSQGRVNGYLHYEHFKNLEYRFQFEVNDMLVMDTKESLDFPFYGTVYGTGSASIAGNARDGVNIDVAMTTNRNTNFVYIKDNVSSAASNQFIKFVDKTPRRAVLDSISLTSDYELAQQEIQQEEESHTDIRLNLLVEATPDATMRIVMDPIAGDYISGRGSGNIRTEFYNKGDDVKMFGNYRISQGVYKFSLQEVIRKDFTIKDGSTINFNGRPLDATMDIQANYTVNSVSLNDLVPNLVNYEIQTNIRVNCTMNLTGQLTSPNIKLGLEVPNERDEVQALIRNYIPTDEQMNMQILYLLGIGKFYPPENVGGTQNSNMMTSVLSSTLSGQLNNALSSIINSNNWNIGTNLSTGEKGWTDMEFEGMLSGQLLNNRLLINGNFGYRDNPLANTNFVGDFEAEWLVNRSGDIRLKAYNETNDRYYTRTNLTTQGIGIIFKKDFNRWKELMFWNRWRLKRLQREMERKEAEKTNEKQPEEPDIAPQPSAKAKEKRGG
ncbi:translocation/assembly module TamB domain-containing protein [uncultured Bacteroides sp.]|uniref:translocation/assembly module TamB domain-containing protein n=1 Tax=uncultured Bacteroides sp. TaxID=162156 RepID=UPI0025D387B5|nr:translocation/assembly module TamB domain-containing protein [uncultured Bacteroides sp.]